MPEGGDGMEIVPPARDGGELSLDPVVDVV